LSNLIFRRHKKIMCLSPCKFFQPATLVSVKYKFV